MHKTIKLRSFKDHYAATDLLNLDGKVPSVRKRLALALKDAIGALNFESKLIDEFYQKISFTHTKRQFRVCLKFMTYGALFWQTFVPYANSKDGKTLIWSGLLMMASIALYILTFSVLSVKHYRPVSLFINVGYLALHISLHVYLYDPAEIEYTPASEILLIMYAILPIRVEITTAIGCLYISAHLSYVEFRVNYYPNISRTLGTSSATYEKFSNPYANKYVTAQIFLWVAFLILGFYTHFSNQFRRRSSFLRLGENVKSQIKNKEAFDSQMRCIEAIMPAAIKNKYWEERKLAEEDDFWVFSKMYENVSILFADMVGFTKMSSNKTATKVVSLLNDLFNRFDNECEFNNCEKLGTLGDCYYCVAGCPLPRSDHAVCCIEMGMGMCRIIQEFNEEYKEEMNMRIGVHTGKVNAAIIGKLRFRFDVYSFDVFIANQMESSGLPGRVHISETTFKAVKLIYTVENGPDMEIKKEMSQGLAGNILKTKTLKTYFILKSSESVTKPQSRKSTATIEYTRLSTESNSESNKRASHFSSDNDEMIDADQKFIDTLTKDPDQTIKLFGVLPIYNFSMKFVDEEIEKLYISHSKKELAPMSIDSVKLAPFLDSIVSTVYSLFIFIAGVILHIDKFKLTLIIPICLYVLGILLTILMGWVCIHSCPMLKGRKLRFFTVVSNSLFQNLITIYMCCLPLMITLTFYQGEKFYDSYLYTASFFSLFFFSLINFILFQPPTTILKLITLICLFSVSMFRIVYCSPITNCLKLDLEPHAECVTQTTSKVKSVKDLALNMALQNMVIFYLLVLLDRENRKNLRLCFYISMEVQKRSKEALRSADEAMNMLHNIIPKYVLEAVHSQGGNVSSGNCYYAQCIENAGVGFACISNFFSSYYREDYQGGKGALRLLNKIICNFDELLREERFKNIEKIKTINDAYMFASGLNISQNLDINEDKKHLKSILKYSFAMKEKLQNFNSQYVFGTEKFKVKIGLNFGTITAGIIGTTKPMYDIWGDTVNVASRMCSNAESEDIQVTELVCKSMSDQFTFRYKGAWNIKGKGRMEIYVCESMPARLSFISVEIPKFDTSVNDISKMD